MPAAGVEPTEGRRPATGWSERSERQRSTEPTADPARTPGYVRSERITAAFRMGDAGPCRTAGTTEAAKTDGHVAHGCAAVASALDVCIWEDDSLFDRSL